MKITTWNIENLTGYKPKTTYFEDFSIADLFGIGAIKETYKNALETAKFMGYVYLTELVMVLNWKIWEHYENNNDYGILYDKLWRKASQYAEKHLKKDELSYYYATID